jgi:DsbC/DsbD-like thiol-disulfide interchange protein
MAARAQEIQLGEARAAAHKGHVTLLSDGVTLSPAKMQTVELRFRVEPGFHINSHAPKDELLIPTELKLDNAGGVTVLGEQYPAGMPFRLAVGDGETLDVYQGEFRVTVRLTAAQGASLLTGSLRYQACDNAACFPPRTLPVKVALSGR